MTDPSPVGHDRIMSLSWIHESPAYWDADKLRIVGGAKDGIFDSKVYGRYRKGDLIGGSWWRVEDGGTTVGYGWMDTNWGDAEVLLAVDPAGQGKGVGTFIMDHLEQEAAARGLNYLYNVVRPTHPDRDELTAWLTKRQFAPQGDGKLLRAATKKS